MIKLAIVCPPMPDWVVNPFPTLGPAILKTFLDSNGYKTDLIDLAVRVRYLNRFPFRKIFNINFFEDKERIINFLENGKDTEIEKEIRKLIKLGNLADYDVIGFSLYDETNITFALCIGKILKKEYEKKIVFGGPSTIRADYTSLLDFEFVDFLIVGDGEQPLLKVLRYFEGECNIENCDGIFYKENGKIHKSNPNRCPIENKPTPSFNIEDLNLYRNLSQKKLLILPYLLSRGCKFKCSFCTEYENVTFNYTPLEKVIVDIKFLLNAYNANSIYFSEANINNDPEYLVELSKKIIEGGLKFSWGGFATIQDLNENKIKLIAQAGCKYLNIGVESVSEPILKKMRIRKVFSLGEFKETLKLLHKYGIKINTFYIVELPGETYEDFKKNLDFIKETAEYITSSSGVAFRLLENSVAFLQPKIFNIKIEEKHVGKYSFFVRPLKFDEKNGLRWEEKYERGKIKEKLLNKIIFKVLRLRFILRTLMRNPLYLIREKISHPYASCDVFFI